jgi:hypothetical protein
MELHSDSEEIVRDLVAAALGREFRPSLSTSLSREDTYLAASGLVSCLEGLVFILPHTLISSHTWSHSVRALLNEVPALGRIFVIDEGVLDFRPTIGDVERTKLRELVRNEYKPRIFV